MQHICYMLQHFLKCLHHFMTFYDILRHFMNNLTYNTSAICVCIFSHVTPCYERCMTCCDIFRLVTAFDEHVLQFTTSCDISKCLWHLHTTLWDTWRLWNLFMVYIYIYIDGMWWHVWNISAFPDIILHVGDLSQWNHSEHW